MKVRPAGYLPVFPPKFGADDVQRGQPRPWPACFARQTILAGAMSPEKTQLVFRHVYSQGGHARRPPCCGQFGENLLRGFGLLGQYELQVVAQRVFDGDDVVVGNPDSVGEEPSTERDLRSAASAPPLSPRESPRVVR